MKKIQVSTVKQTADVEVIFMNTAFVAAIFNAQDALDRAIDEQRNMFNHGFEDAKSTLAALEEGVRPLFDNFMIAFGVKEEAKPEEKKENDPFNSNVPTI